MRTSGILEFSIPSLKQVTTAGAAPTGKSGEIVTVQVLGSLGGGRWQVAVKGKSYTVTSTLSLQVGLDLRAQLVRTSSRVFLKALPLPSGPKPASPLGTLIHDLGLPDDRLSRLALVALQESGIAATADMARTLRSGLERSAAPNNHLARLLALLADRHLELPSDLLETVYLLSEGWTDQQGGGSDGKRRNAKGWSSGEGGDEQLGVLPGEAKPSLRSAPLDWKEVGQAEGSLSSRIARALREQLRDDQAESSPLSLFNHHRGQHDNWIILPFALLVGNRNLRGSVRFLLSPAGRPQQCSIVVAGEGDHPRVSFALRGERPRRLAWYLDGAQSVPSQLRAAALRELPALRENLRNLGTEVDDTMRDGDRFDGFTEEHGLDRPVDRTA